MRRAGGLWPQIAAFDALYVAAKRAARGKRSGHSVASFLERLEPEALQLERELLADTWRPAPTRQFVIHDPKRRTITAVPFRDRVVHHALIAPLQPVLERRMIDDSFACRPGRGTHAALRRAQAFTRRYRHALKLDVRAFFDSLRHDVVLDTLARLVKDRCTLRLCERIVRGPGAATSSRGLPIGSLTSQWFANVVLDRLDHFVKEQLRVPGYLRYLDDFALFADDKAWLWAAKHQVESYLHEVLDLTLKPAATRLAPVCDGLHFLGFHVFPHTLRVKPATLRRFRWRLRWLKAELRAGRIDEDRFIRAVAAVIEHIRQADSLRLRRRVLAELRMELPTEQNTAIHPPCGRAPARPTVWSGAGRSRTTPGGAGLRTATTGTPPTATSTSASAPPARLDRAVSPAHSPTAALGGVIPDRDAVLRDEPPDRPRPG